VPESETDAVAGEAVLVIVTEPVMVLTTVGVNATLRLVVFPAAKVRGKVGGDSNVNCEGLAVKAVRETEPVPVLVTVID
jgi:hypothetical protein